MLSIAIALAFSSVALVPVFLHFQSTEYAQFPFTGDIRARGSAVCSDKNIRTVTAAGSPPAVANATVASSDFTEEQGVFDAGCAFAIFLSMVVLSHIRAQYDRELDEDSRRSS